MSIRLSDFTPEQLKALDPGFAQIMVQNKLSSRVAKLEKIINRIGIPRSITNTVITGSYINGKPNNIELDELNTLLEKTCQELVIVINGTIRQDVYIDITKTTIHREVPFGLSFSEWCRATKHISNVVFRPIHYQSHDYNGLPVINYSNLSIVHEDIVETFEVIKILSR